MPSTKLHSLADDAPLHTSLCSINTERLRIVPCDAVAAPEMARIAADPRVFEPYYVGRAATHDGCAIPEQWQTVCDQWERYACLNLAVHDRATDELLGNVQSTPENVGFFLKPGYWGQGYGSEKVGACCQSIPKLLNLKILHASVIRENFASRRILEKSGFMFCGLSHRPLLNGYGRATMLNYRLYAA